jgi:hypothetical protein
MTTHGGTAKSLLSAKGVPPELLERFPLLAKPLAQLQKELEKLKPTQPRPRKPRARKS